MAETSISAAVTSPGRHKVVPELQTAGRVEFHPGWLKLIGHLLFEYIFVHQE
jgi:hypothetical protein